MVEIPSGENPIPHRSYIFMFRDFDPDKSRKNPDVVKIKDVMRPELLDP